MRPATKKLGPRLADAERAEGAIERQSPNTTQSIKTFARKRMRIEGGGYRRDYLRALVAQRVEVDVKELRILG